MIIKNLGLQPYKSTWQAMKNFTLERSEQTPDEIWLVQHPAVFTQGLNGKPEHILQSSLNIPIIQTDRGGQVTFHGPGQLIAYILIDLKRAKIGVRELIHALENIIIQLLSNYKIDSEAKKEAPGVYVNQQKIASLGLKIRKHHTYHGLSLNINMDLAPFKLINPCGLKNMQMTQVKHHIKDIDFDQVKNKLTELLIQYFKKPL